MTFPSGWNREQLGTLVEITRRPRTLPLAQLPVIPYLPMEAVPTHSLEVRAYSQRPGNECRTGTYFEEGDILVAKITPCFENGKQAIARSVPGGFGIASTELVALKSRDAQVTTEFIAFYLAAPSVRGSLAATMHGATGRQRLPQEALHSLPVPLPPLAEQRRIAAFLTKLQRRVEAERERARLLAALKSATLAKLFREGLRGEPLKDSPIGPIPQSWAIARLGDVSRIGNGSTPKRDNSSFWEGGTLPWLASGSIHALFIRQPTDYVTPRALELCHLPVVPEGSVVVAITGEGKTLGHAAIAEFETRTSQHLAFIVPDRPRLLPDYLLAYLDGQYENFRSVARAGGSTKAALTCAHLRQLCVPLPGLADQRWIGRTLRDLAEAREAVEQRAASLRRVFEAALEQLMAGDLRLPAGTEETEKAAHA